MIYRISVSTKIPDARADHYRKTLKGVFPTCKLDKVSVVAVYTVDVDIPRADWERAAARLANPTTEHYSFGEVPAPAEYAYAVEIGFLPGVTDNVAHTAREALEDGLGRKFTEDEAVYSSYFLFLTGNISKDDAQKIARELSNPLIERASIYEYGADFPLVIPKVHLQGHAVTDVVDLDIDDDELTRIGKEGIANPDGTRRGPLALSLRALKLIRGHFKKEGRNPTDIELESLAQAWSEHCKHTIFADPLDEVEEGIYRRYIKGATEKIRKQKGKKDFCVSVFKDNAGAIAFDDKHLITHKVETHNSPSGLDPFGGSITAIVGVNRDCLGFGLGAKPIANTYGFCVADPNDATQLFRDRKKTQPLLPARRILEGVIKGINAGGNQSGIPTPLGFVAVDPSYRGKPLVYGGTVGLIPRKSPSGSRGKSRKLYEKCAQSGDYIVMAGGRVGLDGIHGATFSSEALSSGSPAAAVQIGDPITQKKMSDALIREARDAGLYSSITDDGAGGLSGSVGEMAKESGGCAVDLEKVPLKYHGLAPWQIWLSESQERMTLAVPKSKWNAFKKICDRHDVEATRIGEFTKSGRVIVRQNKKVVLDIPLSFLHDGRPVERQKSKETYQGPTLVNYQGRTLVYADLGQAILEILARPSVGSTAFISEQYDFEVQGSSVTKPLQGRGRVNADAGVLQPLPDSSRGVVLSHGYCPWYSELDTYAMAAASIDTAVRNAIAAGASRDYLAILDNFCWSSSEKPERLYELKMAAKACYDIATAYGTPFISGKDSMYNDFRGFDAEGKAIHIAALPTLLVSAIGVVSDVSKAMTIDFKQAGDSVYIVGQTNDELGASEYERLTKSFMGVVPHVDTKKNAKAYDAVSKAIQKGFVASAIGVGRGGLGVALAKSAIAGKLGATVELKHIPGDAKTPDAKLFSESQGRMLLSVRPDAEKKFTALLKGVPYAKLGEVGGNSLRLDSVDIPLTRLTESYRSFFKQW